MTLFSSQITALFPFLIGASGLTIGTQTIKTCTDNSHLASRQGWRSCKRMATKQGKCPKETAQHEDQFLVFGKEEVAGNLRKLIMAGCGGVWVEGGAASSRASFPDVLRLPQAKAVRRRVAATDSSWGRVQLLSGCPRSTLPERLFP